MANLIKKIQQTIYENQLFEQGAKIIIAVSGGPDSIALLHIFSQLQKKYSLQLIIAHVNYGLRGLESELDEKLVNSLAQQYHYPIAIKKVNSKELIKKKQGKIDFSEQNLRNIRYLFFQQLKAKKKFNLIATAHNLDDQVETYLMRITRGTGLKGLSAMLFKNQQIIRPLLAVTRAQIMDYLKEHQLEWRLDKTNLEDKFLRNKIRNSLIPYLEKNINPNIKETIFRSIVNITLDENLLEELTQKTGLVNNPLKISLCRRLPLALQRRVLRQIIYKIKGNQKNIGANHIQEILKIIHSSKNKNQTILLAGLKIDCKGDNLNIEKIN